MIATNNECTAVVKNEVRISKHFHITHLNEATIFELDNGQVGSVIALEGIAFDTATNQELNNYKRTLHHAVCQLSDEFCLYSHIIRKKLKMDIQGNFPDEFTSTVNQDYFQKFKNKNFYQNKLYLTVLYKGIDYKKLKTPIKLLQSISNEKIKLARREYRKTSIAKLKQTIDLLTTSLSCFKPHLLGTKDTKLGYSEVLHFLSFFINGSSNTRIKSPDFPSPIGSSIGNTLSAYQYYPEGNIAHYLPEKRLFFGKHIEFKGNNDSSLFASLLSIKTYAPVSSPVMLDKILQLDCEFIYTNSFAIESNNSSQSLINKQIIRLENANDPGQSQINLLNQCVDDLGCDKLKVGYHHNSIMLISENSQALQEAINHTTKIYSDIGFVVVRESIAQETVFWAQIPGNQKYIVRSALITSQNFVDFFPLHNYQTGYCDNNHLGSAVTLLETPSKTPLFFNFHSQGSGDINDLTPGHTTIIGGNGSGKTVFMGFMDSQMTRYGGRSFFFDRDHGLEIYLRATGGQYLTIAPDTTLSMNPFQLENNQTNRDFLVKWFAQLIKEPHETVIPAQLITTLTECIDYAFTQLDKSHRSLSTIVKLLPLDFPRWPQLEPWLRENNNQTNGSYGYLFDNPCDELSFESTKVGFDLTNLLNEPNQILTAVMMYLFHRIENTLNGQRVSIYLDEGWVYLDNSYWQQRLKQWLPTLRKKNCHIVLATQSPASVIESQLSSQFLDNCATHIFFCNPQANYQKHYQHFNISSTEFDFIKNTPPAQRLFLYKQSSFSAIARLNLSNMQKQIKVYSANNQTLTLLQKLRNKVGDTPSKWLPLFYESDQ